MSERWKASDRVLLTELGDGTGVLLHLDSKFYYSLNAAGTEVWKAMEESPCDLERLTDCLVTNFEVGPENARADVIALLDSLRREALIQPVG